MQEDKSTFVINCSEKVDCESIVQSIINKPGKDVLPDKKLWSEKNSGYGELFSLWESGNFNLKSAKWTNYYPGTDYDSAVTTVFENLLGVKTARAWISRIDPGYCTPWHWDTDDNEAHYLTLGKLKRFGCHLSKPAVGQVFLLGKEAHYFWNQGDVMEWNNHRAWHAGFNCGVTPKFMLQLLAYE